MQKTRVQKFHATVPLNISEKICKTPNRSRQPLKAPGESASICSKETREYVSLTESLTIQKLISNSNIG